MREYIPSTECLMKLNNTEVTWTAPASSYTPHSSWFEFIKGCRQEKEIGGRNEDVKLFCPVSL